MTLEEWYSLSPGTHIKCISEAGRMASPGDIFEIVSIATNEYGYKTNVYANLIFTSSQKVAEFWNSYKEEYPLAMGGGVGNSKLYIVYKLPKIKTRFNCINL